MKIFPDFHENPGIHRLYDFRIVFAKMVNLKAAKLLFKQMVGEFPFQPGILGLRSLAGFMLY